MVSLNGGVLPGLPLALRNIGPVGCIAASSLRLNEVPVSLIPDRHWNAPEFRPSVMRVRVRKSSPQVCGSFLLLPRALQKQKTAARNLLGSHRQVNCEASGSCKRLSTGRSPCGPRIDFRIPHTRGIHPASDCESIKKKRRRGQLNLLKLHRSDTPNA